MILQKALTYYRLKEDEIGDSLLEIQLLKEAAKTFNVPISVLRRSIEDELVADVGQGVDTDLSKESEDILVKWIGRRKKCSYMSRLKNSFCKHRNLRSILTLLEAEFFFPIQKNNHCQDVFFTVIP